MEFVSWVSLEELTMKDLVPEERIVKGIYLIRDKKVMMDRDLAALYGVDTAQLKRAVKRNIERFPPDFMFELTKQELEDWRCQFGTSNGGTKMGLRYLPMVFTEQGVAMWSSVLKSRRGLEEFFGYFQLPFSQAYRPLGVLFLLEGFEFCHRHISPAQKNRLSLQQPLQVKGKTGFGVVNIESNHQSLLNQKVD